MNDFGSRLLGIWRRWSRVPGGRWLFSLLVGRVAPYSGSIRPRVLALDRGHARVALTDRRAVRNPFDSVHAVALTNLGEVASGLAMWSLMPARLRGIVLGLRAQFGKKARGRLVGEAHVTLPDVTGPVDHDVTTVIRDADGDVVAEVVVTWRLDVRP